jgi:hypothetical protein
MWNWYYRALATLHGNVPEKHAKPGIPEGYSTHDYVGGSTLLKKRSIREIQERSRRVDEMLNKY